MAAATVMEDVQFGMIQASSLGKVNPRKTAASAYPEGIDQLGILKSRSLTRSEVI